MYFINNFIKPPLLLRNAVHGLVTINNDRLEMVSLSVVMSLNGVSGTEKFYLCNPIYLKKKIMKLYQIIKIKLLILYRFRI